MFDEKNRPGKNLLMDIMVVSKTPDKVI